MEDSEKEKNGILTLIESWNQESISLALEILKGNSDLAKVVKEHYKEVLKNIFSRVDLEDFNNFPSKLGEVLKTGKNIPLVPFLKTALAKVPVYRLNLSYKSFTEIPWWVFYMPQLKELNLRYNSIRKIPSDIEKLINLEVLDLTSNQLTEVPESLGNLLNLEKLQLDFNQIEVLPSNLGKLSKLLWLCLEGNKIEALPKAFKEMKSLSWLSIEKTPLGDKNNINGGMYLSVYDNLFLKLLENE